MRNCRQDFFARRLLGSLCALALFSPCVSFAAASPPPTLAAAAQQSGGKEPGAKLEFVPGEILVRFRSEKASEKSGERAAEAATASAFVRESASRRQIPLTIERLDDSSPPSSTAPLVDGLRVARVRAEDTLAAIAALRERADVLYAEPNYVRRKEALPNDPRFAEMWSLKNTAQFGGQIGADIDAERAWDVTIGSRNVVVGIIDEGVDVNHPDLRDNIWRNPAEAANGVDDDGNGFVDDVHGWDFFHNDASVYDGSASNSELDAHGTFVSGVVGATGANGVGVVGVNWQVSLMSLKILGAETETPAPASVRGTVRAYAYAKTMRDLWAASGGSRGANVRVVNNSYGGFGRSQAELDAINALHQSGVLFVASAGNEGVDSDLLAHYPSNYDTPNMISVAATDVQDALASYSNYGALSVHLAAPGSRILSTYPNSAYRAFNGTSGAAPHVSGAAALICAAHPNISVDKLRSVLLYSSEVVTSIPSSKVLTARRLNAHQALLAAAEQDVTPPAAFRYLRTAAGGAQGRTLTLDTIATGDDGTQGTPALYEFRYSPQPITDPGQYAAALRLPVPNIPQAVFGPSATFISITVPYQIPGGYLAARVIDNVGNAGPIFNVPFLVGRQDADPYVLQTGGAAPLSTGGTPLNLRDDDAYSASYALPFTFPFYGTTHTSLTVSTNGALYFSAPPRRTSGEADDPGTTARDLNGRAIIAGMLEDLRTDQRAGDDIYVVRPSADRIIFRWQGVTYVTPPGPLPSRGAQPINFEIELRQDGAIIFRYGDGNRRLIPTVGISNGAPNAYVVTSHTSEDTLIDLPGAPTVTFTRRQPSATAVRLPNRFLEVSESAGEGFVEVSRTGDLSGTTTVDYSTFDNSEFVNCATADTVKASSRCDYATAVGTLQFAPGETTKRVQIVLNDDALVEGGELFQFVLSNPSGAELNNFVSTEVSVTDNDAASSPANPIDNSSFFVRQQYVDFLSRAPEPTGFDAWLATLNNCSNVNDNPACDRTHVSSSFYFSEEFQVKGYFVFRYYKTSYGRLPSYAEIIADMSRVTGADGGERITRQNAFSQSWVGRAEFKSRYDALGHAAYVDQLLQTAGVQTPARDAWVAALGAGTKTRAGVLREIVESAEVANKFSGEAFVAMQYYGYLRREPETEGFNNWLNTLRVNPLDYRRMVGGFINSVEYRQRFGQP